MFSRILLTIVALFAFSARVLAADDSPGPAGGADAPKVVIPVFKLSGPITESPAAEQLPIFGPPPSSLKDLIERMDKAAKDPGVKAVVLVSEGAQIGLG